MKKGDLKLMTHLSCFPTMQHVGRQQEAEAVSDTDVAPYKVKKQEHSIIIHYVLLTHLTLLEGGGGLLLIRNPHILLENTFFMSLL